MVEMVKHFMTLPRNPQGGGASSDRVLVLQWIELQLEGPEPQRTGALIALSSVTDVAMNRLQGKFGPSGPPPEVAAGMEARRSDFGDAMTSKWAQRWDELRSGELHPNHLYEWMMDELGSVFSRNE